MYAILSMPVNGSDISSRNKVIPNVSHYVFCEYNFTIIAENFYSQTQLLRDYSQYRWYESIKAQMLGLLTFLVICSCGLDVQ